MYNYNPSDLIWKIVLFLGIVDCIQEAMRFFSKKSTASEESLPSISAFGKTYNFSFHTKKFYFKHNPNSRSKTEAYKKPKALTKVLSRLQTLKKPKVARKKPKVKIFKTRKKKK